MKVSLAQHELARGIATVGRAVPTAARKALPSTTTILLATDGGQLRLSATDLEIAITLWLPAMIEQEGSTFVDYEKAALAEPPQTPATSRQRLADVGKKGVVL